MMFSLLLGLGLARADEPLTEVTTTDDPVFVEIVEVRDLKISRSGLDFVVVARMTRTRGLPIVLTDMQYEVLVGKQMLASAWQADEKVKLRRGQSVEVPIPCSISAAAGLGALKSLASEGVPPVMLSGTVEGRVLFLPGEYSFVTDLYTPER